MAEREDVLKELADGVASRLSRLRFTNKELSQAMTIYGAVIADIQSGASFEKVVERLKASVGNCANTWQLTEPNCYDLIQEVNATLLSHYQLYRHFLTEERVHRVKKADHVFTTVTPVAELPTAVLGEIRAVEEEFSRKRQSLKDSTAQALDGLLGQSATFDGSLGLIPSVALQDQPVGLRTASLELSGEVAAKRNRAEVAGKHRRQPVAEPPTSSAAVNPSVSGAVEGIVDKLIGVKCGMMGVELREMVEMALLKDEERAKLESVRKEVTSPMKATITRKS